MAAKIVTVFGATGNQGGSVIKAILDHPTLSKTFKIRAVTRDPTKRAGQELARRCEVVKADLGDLESVASAVKGAYAVFAVTNFWELLSYDKEVAQGKAITDACIKAGVKHFVWSSLPAAKKLTGGKIARAEHFDSKAAVEEYIEEVKGDMISSYVLAAFFTANFPGMTRERDGVLTYVVPLDANTTRQPFIDIQEDFGKYVAGVLEAGEKANGLHVNAVTEWMNPVEIAKALGNALGKEVKFQEISDKEFHGMWPNEVMGDELLDTLLLIRDYSYYGAGEEEKQAESDKYLAGYEKSSLEKWVKRVNPWK